MLFLVDYDNIDRGAQRRGLAFLMDAILNCVGPHHLIRAGIARVHFRLYGGWHEGRMPTRRAQQLMAEIERVSPMRVEIVRDSKAVTVSASAEMAIALHDEPGRVFYNTFRAYEPPQALEARPIAELGCERRPCPLSGLRDFLSNRHCGVPGCVVEPSAMLFVPQQKLVDTMLVVDLLSAARREPPIMAVVSSDDDMWPGIRSALHLGREVLHVHTQRARFTSPEYCGDIKSGYRQFNLHG
jgi:hypothetical protein